MYFLFTQSPEITVPKLMHVLANRYKDRQGGYVRILKNGYRANASDRAPLAIIELINNPNDVIYHLAQKQRKELERQLEEVEEKRYIRKVVNLVDPSTGKPLQLLRIKERPQLKVVEKRKIGAQELALHKKIIRFRKSLESYPRARSFDKEAEEKLASLTADSSSPFHVPYDRLAQILPVQSKVKTVERLVIERAPTPATPSVEVESGNEPTQKPTTPAPPKSFLRKLIGYFK
jgi:hypothetical protein